MKFTTHEMVMVSLILASSLSLYGSAVLVGSVSTLTTTMTTTIEVSYNYFASWNSTTSMAAYLTTSTLTSLLTVTSTFAGSVSEASGPFPTLGLDSAWIVVGLILGILALYLIRKHAYKA